MEGSHPRSQIVAGDDLTNVASVFTLQVHLSHAARYVIVKTGRLEQRIFLKNNEKGMRSVVILRQLDSCLNSPDIERLRRGGGALTNVKSEASSFEAISWHI